MDIHSMTEEEVFQALEKKAQAHPDLIKELNATYSVQLKGKEAKTYYAKFNNGDVEMKKGQDEEADCTLILSFENFKKLLLGNLNATTAVMTGKVKVKGNIGLALKLEQILKQFSF